MTLTLHNTIKIQNLEANTQGRDFIVGDLHGHYDKLITLLKFVKFSKKHDRLISTGDLIDRGPKSVACLGLLKEAWFYSILGNHDIAFVINLIGDKTLSKDDQDYYTSVADLGGGEWYLNSKSGKLKAYCTLLNNLPHIITVGTNNYHVVHASLHPESSKGLLTLGSNALPQYLVAKNQSDLIHSLTGDRALWKNNWSEIYQPLAQTYCGHTPSVLPRWALHHLNIDLGAGHLDKATYSRRLALVCHQTQEFWTIPTNQSDDIVNNTLPKPVLET